MLKRENSLLYKFKNKSETNNNIDLVKVYYDKYIWKHECDIYLHLLIKHTKEVPFIPVLMSPIMIGNNYKLVYRTRDLVSLRIFLMNNPDKIIIVLNELMNFVSYFYKHYNFIHRNLDIDNIYLSNHEDIHFIFHVVDFSNSIIMNEETEKSQRTSLFDVVPFSNCNNLHKLFDFFTIYTSLMLFIDSKSFLFKNIKNYKNIILDLIKSKSESERFFILKFNEYCLHINKQKCNELKIKYKSM